jgi:hypothetical protein
MLQFVGIRQILLKLELARPRFELGSKAPKASMLGHYIQRFLILYRAAGHFFIEYLIYKATNLSIIFINLFTGSSIRINIRLA